ncbi:glycoside hydrolase family 15 protein [Streptacidiphilus monticola]
MAPGAPPPQPLVGYALLADGERGALVGPQGEVVWLCAPRWDSDAVFSHLVGGPGWYQVCPVQTFVPGGHYEAGSLVWRSRWITHAGILECREALAFPGDPHRTVLLRRLTARSGRTTARIAFEPAAGFGSGRVDRLRRDQDGVWTADLGGLRMRWRGARDARMRGGVLVFEVELTAGQEHDLVLELSDRPLPEPVPPDELWRATETAWRQALPALGHRDVRHACTVLRGLTGSSGGTVAAATTSLPERAEQGRNYDYRYVWIRDLSYIGLAAAAAGAEEMLDGAVRFVTERLLEHGERLAPAYTVAGDPIPDQRQLDLPGYPGGFDLVGNTVAHQFQLDAFGESLLLLAEAARLDRLDGDGHRAVRLAVDAVAARRRQPDSGIWELEPRRWTHSRLSCVAGLRAAAGNCALGGRAAEWAALADRVLAETAADSLHRSGRWQRAPDDPSVDAALLLPPLRGALPRRTRAAWPRWTRSCATSPRGLRLPIPPRRAAARGRRGRVPALRLRAGPGRARAGPRADRSPPLRTQPGRGRPAGLYAEEFDVAQSQLRGNLPQAFVHALQVEAATRLAGEP